MEVAIEVKNLTKKIKNTEIVKDVSFEIYKGEVFGFIGPNGAGKTTTMRMMVGLIDISEGEIIIHGSNIKNNKKNALRNIGAIIENPQLYTYMTGRQNLKIFASLHQIKSKEKIQNIIDLVGLTKGIDKKVSNFSLGMRQRLGIAQALLHEPKVLILDEPTNGLDPSGIQEMRQYLRDIAKHKNMSVMVSSHLINEIELMCDRIGIIKEGELVTVESVKDYKTDKTKITYSLGLTPLKEAISILEAISLEVIESLENEEIILECNEEEIPELINELVRNKIQIHYVERKKIRLEDRFMEITKTE